MRPGASPSIIPRLATGAAACADQVRHHCNNCPKWQKSSVILASPASSRTPGTNCIIQSMGSSVQVEELATVDRGSEFR
ncbi:hypothetical protein VC83_06595 [Pseudogymnoascus destructans]|uniref:Uncharacterized protein n=1 Tax=Pseudogymnoascus destructans TaxID=655981 RepID=A0A177A884_9PEZI|nr:uncharacterized protein VC83_06595 [Pseudogymnoascus destructans]OAF58356.1 hypothetical protein VC83_06595 [Pseudogymnoascus destructans]